MGIEAHGRKPKPMARKYHRSIAVVQEALQRWLGHNMTITAVDQSQGTNGGGDQSQRGSVGEGASHRGTHSQEGPIGQGASRSGGPVAEGTSRKGIAEGASRRGGQSQGTCH